MRIDVAVVLDRLRDARDPELLRLIDQALAEGGDRLPDIEAVEPYRWFLQRLGDGVKLTSAGYLPPALVSETMQTLGWHAEWIGAGNREDLTLPVAELRQSAQRLGLVRRYGGKLQPIASARRYVEDPAALWGHIARRLPLGSNDPEPQTGVLWLLAVAAGRSAELALVGRGLHALGWVDQATRRPPDAMDVKDLIEQTEVVFERMGLLSRRGKAASAGAAALARAALLGDEAAAPAAPDPPAETAGRMLEVSLVDVEPLVWRRIVVPESLSLAELHPVLQTAMGWEDYHLHLFEVGGVRYGDVEEFPGTLGDEQTTTVGDVAARVREFDYEYDFGDSWDHRIQIGDPTSAPGAPRCLDGARACPPEDCGGASGYERLRSVLADPADPEHDELLEWVGGEFDPEAFDLALVNELLQLYDRHTRQRRRR